MSEREQDSENGSDPRLKDRTVEVMVALSWTCCLGGAGCVYRDDRSRVKTGEKVTKELRQLLRLLWAFYNIPLSLNELPGDTVLNSTR